MHIPPTPPRRVEILKMLIFDPWISDRTIRVGKIESKTGAHRADIYRAEEAYMALIEQIRAIIAENEELKLRLFGQTKTIEGDFYQRWEDVSLESLQNMEALGLLQLSDI